MPYSLMDIIKIRYNGRVSAGIQKKFALDIPRRTKSSKELYMEKVLSVHHYDEAKRLADYMGLSSVSNLQKEPEPRLRKPRGSKGISSGGRQLVKDAALYLQERYGRERLSFLTLTIPPEAMTHDLFHQWSEIARKLRQRLFYALGECGLPQSIVGVQEVQEERQKNCGNLPALHWHLVFVGAHKAYQWELSKEYFAEMWGELLSRALNRHIDASSATRVESIRESASAYLGKYMSKGVSALSMISTEYLPASWYMCTRELLKIVNRLTVYATGKKAEQLYEWIRKNENILRFHRDVKLQIDEYKMITIGWYGDLTNRDTYRDLIWIAGDILKPT